MRVDQISQTGVAFEEAHKHVGGVGIWLAQWLKYNEPNYANNLSKVKMITFGKNQTLKYEKTLFC